MNNKLQAIEGAIFTLKQLKLIDLSRNQIALLPESLGECTSLVEFLLVGNKLQGLPLSIGQLSKLEVLDLSANSIGVLPPSFGNLVALKRLNLSANQLRDVPDSIGSLGRLEDLNMASNKIASIHPMSLSRLTSLVVLNLTRNELKTFSAVPQSPKLDSLLLVPSGRTL